MESVTTVLFVDPISPMMISFTRSAIDARQGADQRPAVAPERAAARRKPTLTHTFEFRFSGSEKDQTAPVSGSVAWPLQLNDFSAGDLGVVQFEVVLY